MLICGVGSQVLYFSRDSNFLVKCNLSSWKAGPMFFLVNNHSSNKWNTSLQAWGKIWSFYVYTVKRISNLLFRALTEKCVPAGINNNFSTKISTFYTWLWMRVFISFEKSFKIFFSSEKLKVNFKGFKIKLYTIF